MLRARRISIWKPHYEIVGDGIRPTTWNGSSWKHGGHFELDRRRYEIRGNLLASKYDMVTEDGTSVAAAQRVGRKRWTVEAGGQTYDFQRASIWRREEQLLRNGAPIGTVRRTSWRQDAMADLPGLPLPVQVFVLAVVLTTWDSGDSATAG